jgi:hypothetical protein
VTGRRLLGALTAIVLATAILPPAAAWWVTVRRVHRAEATAAALAYQLRSPERAALLDRLAIGAGILYGEGRVPSADHSSDQHLLAESHGPLSSAIGAPVDPDPWGNCYIVRVLSGATGPGAEVWVISAGPNGIVETTWSVGGTVAVGGDDVGVRVK